MTERIIDLDNQQYKELYKVFHGAEVAPRLLADMLQELIEQMAYDVAESWDEVYRLAEADRETENVKICWVTKSILVTPRKPGCPDEKS